MNIQISHELPPRLSLQDWVALDLELFDAEKKKLHRPTTGTFACLSICYSPDLVHVILDSEQIPSIIQHVEDAVWIFHNAAFDITHLRRWADIRPRKKIWDVMIVERDMCGGLYELFSLEDIVRRRLNRRMDKDIRTTFENKLPLFATSSNSMTNEQIQYAANDALVTWLVCEAQKKEITKSDYKIWTDVDRPALWAMLDFQGFRLDAQKWKELADRNNTRAEEIKASLPFNPASPAQVKQALIKGGFKRLKSTGEQCLQNATTRMPDVVAVDLATQVLEYRKYAKRASTYGHNFIGNYLEEEDGYNIIRPSWWVTGAGTGRTSSSSPNCQNIPIKDTNEFRECFIARPNHKLVIADMGQQEARILAYVSQDEVMVELFRQRDKDVFIEAAKLIFEKSIAKSDPLRKTMKNIFYGLSYGMSPPGFVERYGGTIDEVEAIFKRVFSTFRGLYNWMEQQRRKKDYITTIAGRKIWLNQYSEGVERNAINGVPQGSAADQIKIGLGNIHEKWGSEIDVPYCGVAHIHDELIFDAPVQVAERVGQFITREMINAAETQCEGVPFVAEYKICDTWSEKDE